MSRNAMLGLTVFFGLGLIVPDTARAQNVRPDAPDISVLYWYNKTNPQGTIKFQVYDGAYPQGPVRDWMARNKVNDINSDLRGCPYDAPFRVQLSRYPGYRNGTMTKEDVVRAVKEQVTKNLPAPVLPFQRIPTVDVRPLRTEGRPTGAATGFTYNPNAPKQPGKVSGTTWGKRMSGINFTMTFNPNGTMESSTNSAQVYLHRRWRQDGNKVYTRVIGVTNSLGFHPADANDGKEDESTVDGDRMSGYYDGWQRVK